MIPTDQNKELKVDEENDTIFEAILEKNVQMLTKSVYSYVMTVIGRVAEQMGRDAGNEVLMEEMLSILKNFKTYLKGMLKKPRNSLDK